MPLVWSPATIGAICTICLLSALTMPAGIGGGILFVPVLRLIGGMDQSLASALSQILITGASIGSILFQIWWQYSHKSEPLLAQPYYVILMLPALLTGSLVGVYLNHLLPALVSLIVLVCLCALSSVMIFRKGITTWRRENEIAAARRSAASPSPPLPLPGLEIADRAFSMMSIEAGINVLPATGMYEAIENPSQSFMYENTAIITPSMSVISISSLRKRQRSRRASFVVAQEADIVSGGIDHAFEDRSVVKQSWLMRKLTKSAMTFSIFVIGYWIYLVVMTLLRGSRSNPSFSGIEPCKTGYWIITGFQAGIGISISLFVAPKEWLLILETFLTGVVATISGASGGIILNPLLLNRGLDPQQTSATSTVIMFVMASCSSLEFLLDGRVEAVLASLMAVTFVGSVAGMTLVTWLVKKLGRQSLLVFLLGALVVIGGIMLIYLGIVDVIDSYNRGDDPFKLGQLC
jgi:uncharacterized membrane protein YfcA